MESIGKYRVIRELGKGATATVYLCDDPERTMPVAIKLIRFAEKGQAKWNRRLSKLFRTELMVSQRLDHPNIAKVYEAALEDEYAYLVMEFIDGVQLSEYCEFDKLLPLDRVVAIIHQCCLALDYAYRCGVVHRDIKPANIMVDQLNNVKLMDFGLALNLSKELATDSTFINGVGSPAYMSPEQIKGYPLNQKTDLYSTGVVLFNLLTGRLPFRADNVAQMVYKIINVDPPAVSRINPNVPKAMDVIVRKALEKDLYSRYKTGAQFSQDLSSTRFQIIDETTPQQDTTRFEVLRKMKFFFEFENLQIWEVLRVSRWREIEPETLLMREGDHERSFGIIVAGEVEVSVGGKLLCRLGPGEAIGEMSYLDANSAIRNVTVVTLTRMTYLDVNPAALELASEECIEHFRTALVSLVVQRLQAANKRLAGASIAAQSAKRVDKLELELEPMKESWRRG